MPACPSCGRDNPGGARFCMACATPLAAAPGEERKVVTVLFCDLVGFTALADDADPEDVRATLRPYHARLLREIERLGGTVEKFIGDAVMAVFGAPTAHEDDAERAVRCGLGILEAISELNRGRPGPGLAVRVGINTGEALVSPATGPGGREGLVAGDVVNTASRIESAAPPGTVLVGEATYRATRHRSHQFRYRPLEPVAVKGKARPVPVWEAVAAPSAPGARPAVAAPFVGREDELEILRRTFSRAVREPSLQLVTLLGEPGAGKSRLLREFAGVLEQQGEDPWWRQGRCLPYGDGITFWPLGEIVKAHAGILESDSPEEAGARLERSLVGVVPDPGERAWLRGRLGPLVGLPGPEVPGGPADRADSFGAWRRFLESLAAARPLVLVFEDLHWADPAMLEFLEHLVDWTTGVPVLVACTARQELYGRHPGWGGGMRNSTTISLPPLTPAEMGTLVSGLLPGVPLPPEDRDRLIERAGGNPLYAEEFARMVLDRDLVAEGDRPLPFPDTVQAIIAARLDALPPEQKALLQDASVVGTVFWSGALSAMSGLDPRRVAEGLHELARRELVRPARTSSVRDQAEHSFWHFLVRDVAYAQIPRAARARKHRRFAGWLEGVAGERVADHAEVLAHHYHRALELARASGSGEGAEDLRRPAFRSLVMAGERAMGLDARRAAEHFQSALDLLDPEDRERGPVLARAAEAAAHAGSLPRAEDLYREAIVALRAGGDEVGAASAMVGLSKLLWRRGDTARCREVLGEAIDILEREEPGPELARAYTEVASDRLSLGHLEEALRWARKALALEGMLGLEPGPAALAVQGMARSSLGDLGGLDDLRRALDASRALGAGRETARLQAILAELVWLTEGPASSLAASEAALGLAEQRGDADLAAAIRAQTLGPLFDLGRWDELVEAAGRIAGWSLAAGEGYFAVLAECYRAMVLLSRGDTAGASSLAREFLPAARGIGDPQVLVTALAVSAVVEQARDNPAASVELIEELEAIGGERSAWHRAQHLPDLVRACAGAREVAMAERLLRDVPGQAWRHRLGRLAAEAVLREARGDLEGAARAHREAAAGWAAFGHRLEEARARLGAGRCLAQQGGPEAVRHLQEARGLLASLGAGPLEAEADSWLRRTAVPNR